MKNEDLNNSAATPAPFVNNGPARDFTLERLMEADQMSDSKCGDNSLQFLRISGENAMVPQEYRVRFHLIHFLSSLIEFVAFN